MLRAIRRASSQNLGLARFVLAVAAVNVRELLAVGIADNVAARYLSARQGGGKRREVIAGATAEWSRQTPSANVEIGFSGGRPSIRGGKRASDAKPAQARPGARGARPTLWQMSPRPLGHMAGCKSAAPAFPFRECHVVTRKRGACAFCGLRAIRERARGKTHGWIPWVAF
jgi:hypothetical protein